LRNQINASKTHGIEIKDKKRGKEKRKEKIEGPGIKSMIRCLRNRVGLSHANDGVAVAVSAKHPSSRQALRKNTQKG
jgi:hypothetical protein